LNSTKFENITTIGSPKKGNFDFLAPHVHHCTNGFTHFTEDEMRYEGCQGRREQHLAKRAKA
jgi:hypothetical protein